MAPLGVDGGELSGPPVLDEDFAAYRLQRVAVFVRGTRIVGYVTTNRDVELGKGVGIGDSISLINDRKLPFHCEGVSLGSDSNRPAYPACDKPVRGNATLFAGGDPIDSIWLVPHAPQTSTTKDQRP
jgi:hypothetical protein